ncbi:MAG: Ig domain-containing protein, partial [Planctomycetota bacterium]
MQTVLGLALSSIVLATSSAPAGSRTEPQATCGPIQLNPTLLPRPLEGLDYSAELTASGGIAPYSYVVTQGSLPAGLTLGSNGSLSGVPLAPEATLFSVMATDADGCTGDASWILSVAAGYPAADDQVGLAIPPVGSGGTGQPALDRTVSSLLVSGERPGVGALGIDVHV